MFLLHPLPLPLPLPATGLAMDCSSCTLAQTDTAIPCGRFASTNCSIHQTFVVHHARVEIRLLYAFFLGATALSKVVWHSVRFSTLNRAFTNWNNEFSLVLVIT